ncbi:MAG: MOSC domain-containing protein [Dehalococcoidia bacterium]|nr:MAG: MOSC domain-containing protein [Dehalococcoidia bacterium]
MTARLISLNVGQPAPLRYRQKWVTTAFGKQPVSGGRRLTSGGIDGDAQADRSVHGGPAKAACVYPVEHYPIWTARLGRSLAIPSFGENFTTEGLLEEDVCIGDRFRVGQALVEVSQPRQPCFKLATWNGEPRFARWVQESGRTGFYFRCLEEGVVQSGDLIVLVERPFPWATIAEANRLMHRTKQDRAGLERMLALPALSESWRQTFQRRLAGIVESSSMRLDGPPD